MDAGQEIESSHLLPTTSAFFAGAKLAKSKPYKNIETKPCVFCHEIHAPTECSNITDTESRNCLGNHRLNECKSENTCRYCNRKHHTSLSNAHKSNDIKQGNEESDRNGGNTSTHTNFRANNNQSSNPLNPPNPPSLNSTNVHLVNDSFTTEQDTTILETLEFGVYRNQYSKEIEEDDTYTKAFARLAWKEDSDKLPTNSTVTKKRTQNVTTNLIKTPDMLKGYGEIIQEHKGRRFRKKVTETTEISRKANPDHPVHRKSSTSRIRIVNNCRKRKRWKSEYHMLLREFLRKIISVGSNTNDDKQF
ncbi:unnamed protein product [Mytilus edulis]|uniref:Uncharacterized protein n=1 Tax=Mytilus edulis TaxID=6550 RepID=A0A8S3URE8_MYTED|nr:unnamed protein product [Mytilus edulis]